jgi:transposase
MNEVTRVAIDTSKCVFTLHGVDRDNQVVLRRNLRRRDFVGFFAKLAPVDIALEACGGSHHWGRTLQALGHRVRLIPSQYVKPFVKRAKNDRNDAEAISEAAARPGMREVPVKSAEVQAQAMLLRVRELLVRQRTQLVNALRGHAAEFGLVAAVGNKGLAELRTEIAAEGIAAEGILPAPAVEALGLLGREIDRLETQLALIEAKLMKQHKANADSYRLSAIPGVGPRRRPDECHQLCVAGRRNAVPLRPSLRGLARPRAARTFDRRQTASRRDQPGRQRAAAPVLVLGATAVIRYAKPGRPNQSPWLLALLERRPRKLAAVALANKMARIVWAMLRSAESYRPQSVAAG